MKQIVLVAIDIRSTHNVGAFFRTCDGFGADLVLTGITPCPSGKPDDTRLPHIRNKLDKAISKTALGAEHTVEWRYFATAQEAITTLKDEGYTVAAIEQDNQSMPIQSMKDEKLTLLVGPEVTGLPQDTLELCDVVYEISMIGTKESFNVSVAAGIALYQASLL